MNQTPQTPQAISAQISDLHANANKAFVPANLVRAAELQVAFNAAVVEVLGHAGLLPADEATDQPAN